MKSFLYLFFVIIIFCEIFAVLFPLYWYKNDETITCYISIYIWGSFLKILFTIGMVFVLCSQVDISQSILRLGRYLLLMTGAYSFLPDVLNLFTLLFPSIEMYCLIINSVLYLVLLILGFFLFFSKEYFYGIFFPIYAIYNILTVCLSLVIVNSYLGTTILTILCLLGLLLLFFLWYIWIHENKRNDILNCFGYIITSVMLIGVMIPEFLLWCGYPINF
ncbi:MAG: hypothetical protein LBP87_07410 [Planctomycetaceae bacterium]|jgi:hypothetical protein|nr:hypothetical protein [Planctomycetaceae bacterium]